MKIIRVFLIFVIISFIIGFGNAFNGSSSNYAIEELKDINSVENKSTTDNAEKSLVEKIETEKLKDETIEEMEENQ